jgi:alanine-glyoxylate transaminase / serine-glyoxylate transaminase / serine-pyruvate transaminase
MGGRSTVVFRLVPNVRFRHLHGPGPSIVSQPVLEAMAIPLMGHLDPEFLALLDEIAEMLRQTFRTSNEVTFAASGTGSAGMEMALVNLLEPGDVCVVGIAGAFGIRLAEIARRCGATVRTVEAEWGGVLQPEQFDGVLDEAKVVAFVHAETSTGAWQPVEEIAARSHEAGALVVLDAVTSLAGVPVEVDGWGIDVCYSGTQKCLSVPPGLSPITFSTRAVDAVHARKSPVQSWYLDLSLLTKYWGDERVYHHTAPITMLYGLHEGLRLVLEEGLEARWERHAKVGAMLQRELVGMGFTLFASEGHRLPQLTAAFVPEGIDADKARRQLLEEFDVEVGGGFGPLSGRGWRIGLMGESAHPDRVEFLLEAIRSVIGG